MYLTEDRILLDAHVTNQWQGTAKPIVTNLIFSWTFEIFVSFYSFCIYSELISIHCSTSFCPKKGREERKKGRKWMIFCMLSPWNMLFIEYHSFNNIWTHNICMQWWNRLFNKVKIRSCIKKIIIKVKPLLSCHATQVWSFQSIALAK